jgi:hypothetical protein
MAQTRISADIAARALFKFFKLDPFAFREFPYMQYNKQAAAIQYKNMPKKRTQ